MHPTRAAITISSIMSDITARSFQSKTDLGPFFFEFCTLDITTRFFVSLYAFFAEFWVICPSSSGWALLSMYSFQFLLWSRVTYASLPTRSVLRGQYVPSSHSYTVTLSARTLVLTEESMVSNVLSVNDGRVLLSHKPRLYCSCFFARASVRFFSAAFLRLSRSVSPSIPP